MVELELAGAQALALLLDIPSSTSFSLLEKKWGKRGEKKKKEKGGEARGRASSRRERGYPGARQVQQVRLPIRIERAVVVNVREFAWSCACKGRVQTV